MDLADVQRACEEARKVLSHYRGDVEPQPLQNGGSEASHVFWMLITIPIFMREGRTEKAMRWLGFVQGFLWARGMATIDEMKAANRPRDAA